MDGLDRLGILKQKSTGGWEFNIKSQTRSANPFDFDYMQIHQTGLKRCLMTLDLIGKTTIHDPKHFFMNIIAVNEDDQKKVLSLFEKFKNDLWEITHASAKPDRVMLISNCAISLNGAEI